jgi:thiamine pyrophosphokinase
MSYAHITIVANGTIDFSLLSDHKSDYLIACDRAAYILLKERIMPQAAVGDFDSATRNEYEEIHNKISNVQKFPTEKNETDIELAITYALSLNPSTITILGGTGGRLDHELSLIFLLEKIVKKGIDVHLIDKSNKITLIDKNTFISKDKKYRYISIIPYSERTTLTLHGFKYDVTKTVFKKSESLGISNEILGDNARIIVHEGSFFLIASSDAG